MNEARIRLGGLRCANCAKTIETRLAKEPGILSAQVNFAASSLLAVYDPQKTSLDTIITTIRDLGYSAELPDATGVLQLQIRGMHCTSCARNLEETLGNISGVTGAQINFAAESGRIDYDPALTDEAAIETVIRQAGFTPIRQENDDSSAAEARRDLYWTIFALVLSTPVMLLMFFPGGHSGVGLIVSALLATIVQFSAGLTFYRGAWQALRNRNANMDTLVALGISAAWGYSVLALFGLLGADAHNFFETAAMLVAFIRLGKWLEARARGKASLALRRLLSLAPDQATRLAADGREETVATASLVAGDRFVVRPGERIAVDGTIESGESAIDEAMLTGESAPNVRGPGDSVTGGTISRSGRIVVRATAVGSATALFRIVRMVEDAQADKAPIQRLADRVSAVFVPVVLFCSLLTLAGWLLAGKPFVFAFQAAVAVVVIACPCALGLATPTAIMVGSAIGLQRGILFKRAAALEKVARLDTILFDKTGTLTTGQFSIAAVVAVDGDRESLLARAAAAEHVSSHPLAVAIVAAAQEQKLTIADVSDVEEIGGHGVVCRVAGKRLVAGSRRLCEKEGIDLSPLAADESRLLADGASLVFVASDQQLLGVIALADTPRPEAAEAIRRLKKLGIVTAMLTGDRREAAARIAARLGIDEVEAEILPGDKLAAVKARQNAKRSVGMVGDGINDAPALAGADVGIAIGAGTDIAKETGEIVLVRDDLLEVEKAVRLGRATLAKIRQNLFWAFFYNIAGIPLAAGLFYPAFGLLLRPEFAGLAMAFSSVSVVSNSLLLRRFAKRLQD